MACPAQDDQILVEFTAPPPVGEVVNVKVADGATVKAFALGYG
jgi:hypothetical protein